MNLLSMPQPADLGLPEQNGQRRSQGRGDHHNIELDGAGCRQGEVDRQGGDRADATGFCCHNVVVPARDRDESVVGHAHREGAWIPIYGLTPDAAFDLLRRHYQNRNIKVRDVAAALTEKLIAGAFALQRTVPADRLLDTQ